jgi:dihydrofolate synthase/folylpolyglutamate synthase
MRTSDEVLEGLHKLHPLMIDLSLGRIERLLEKLGNPHRKLPPVIHIAGTNGKGSTTAFIKAMLEAAGLRTHVYTSPHLVKFHERIQLPGAKGKAVPVSEEVLVELLDRVEKVNAGDQITFFEITTAAAFLAFAEHPADAVVLEVGLGGRLDTTNVVERPALTIITPVSMDHADKLGATIGLIAGEKAGILKPGVKGVISQQTDEAFAVIERTAARVRAPLCVWGRDFDAYEQNGRLVFQSESRLLDLPRPALVGRHQVVNAGTAVAAGLELSSLGITPQAIERGLVEVVWPARMQRLTSGPLVDMLGPEAELWLDGGHNPAGGQALAQTLADLDERSPKPVYLVVGMLGQKDAAGFLEPFAGIARRLIAVPVPGPHEVARTTDDLVAIATSAGLPAEPAHDVPSALQLLRTLDPGPKRVLICGSLYLAGSVLAVQRGDRAALS